MKAKKIYQKALEMPFRVLERLKYNCTHNPPPSEKNIILFLVVIVYAYLKFNLLVDLTLRL